MKSKSSSKKDASAAAQSPARLAARIKTAAAQKQQQPLQCANCGTSTTPVWRRDSDRRRLCNACGLYFKSHKTSRGSEVSRPGSQPSSSIPLSGAYSQVDAGDKSGNSSASSSRNNSYVPGGIQLPVIPRWPTTAEGSSTSPSTSDSVPSQHPPHPQRSHSFAGTPSSPIPFFTGYKLAPLGGAASGSLSNNGAVNQSQYHHFTGGVGIVDELPPLSLATSSLSISGHHFPPAGSGSSSSHQPHSYSASSQSQTYIGYHHANNSGGHNSTTAASSEGISGPLSYSSYATAAPHALTISGGFAAGGGSGGSGSGSPSSSSSPSTPPYAGPTTGHPHFAFTYDDTLLEPTSSHFRGSANGGGNANLGPSTARISSISTFFRQNSLPALPPLQTTHLSSSSPYAHSHSHSNSSSSTAGSGALGYGPPALPSLYTGSVNSSSTSSLPLQTPIDPINSHGGGGVGSGPNWLVDALDDVDVDVDPMDGEHKPPATASSTTSTTSSSLSPSSLTLSIPVLPEMSLSSGGPTVASASPSSATSAPHGEGFYSFDSFGGYGSMSLSGSGSNGNGGSGSGSSGMVSSMMLPSLSGAYPPSAYVLHSPPSPEPVDVEGTQHSAGTHAQEKFERGAYGSEAVFGHYSF